MLPDIDTITGARASDDDLYPVEFLCKMRYRDPQDWYRWITPAGSKAWEGLAALWYV